MLKDAQYYKFCLYGFLKEMTFFEPFFLLFLLSRGLSFLEIGFLYSLREIFINIFEIPTGVAADVLGRRQTMISSFLFYIISFIVFYFSDQYFLLIVAIILFALGEAFRTGTHKAMIFEYLKIKGIESLKVHYYGHTRSWSQKGAGLSALIGAGFVFYSGSYDSVFIYAVIPFVINLILMTTYPKELDGKTVDLKTISLIPAFKSTITEFLNNFKSVEIFRAVASLSLHTGFYKAVRDYLQPVLKALAVSLPFFASVQDEKRSALIIGIIYSLIFFLTSTASKNSGKFSEKFGSIQKSLNITFVAGLIFGILSGILYESGLLFLSVFFYTAVYLNENLRKPIGIAYFGEKINTKVLASSLSAESQANTLAAAIIAPIIGFFADAIGIGWALILVSSVLLILSPLFRLKQN